MAMATATATAMAKIYLTTIGTNPTMPSNAILPLPLWRHGANLPLSFFRVIYSLLVLFLLRLLRQCDAMQCDAMRVVNDDDKYLSSPLLSIPPSRAPLFNNNHNHKGIGGASVGRLLPTPPSHCSCHTLNYCYCSDYRDDDDY